MILTFDSLAQKFGNYTDVRGKIRREVQSGRLTQVARGLYSLIPEAVIGTYTSATFRKGKTKQYENAFGVFTYRDIPSAAYPFGVQLRQEGGYSYQVATPEKALCDKLYAVSPVGSVKALRALLFDDLRIDEGEFGRLNFDDVRELAPLYRSTNHNYLIKLLGGREWRRS